MNGDPTAYYVVKSKTDDEVIFLMRATSEIISDATTEQLFKALLKVFSFELISKTEFTTAEVFKVAPVITQDDITFFIFEDQDEVNENHVGLVGVCTTVMCDL